ncbi:MAG: Fic family protein [Chloroflexi bacterium]|nr:Fic family protein [Chloroflexota bacterium]
MDPLLFTNPAGRLLSARSPNGREYWSFVPDGLPPVLDPAELGGLVSLISDASLALGRLDGLGQILPNPDLLVRPYMRREAVLSSRIEGTRTSFAELLAFEAAQRSPAEPDAREVLNYVVALDAGLHEVRRTGITPGLVRDLHRRLMTATRDAAFATPGEFRHVQNHIGDTGDPADARFVPPPPDEMETAMSALFDYLHAPASGTPVLVEAAWMHYQFETIHPFRDGNGRVGRLLIPLLLAWRGRLSQPLLYLSAYFEQRRGAYYDRLLGVSARSEWAAWLRFFLEAVVEQSASATELARAIIAIGQEWHEQLTNIKASQTAHRLADLVHAHIAVDASTAARMLGLKSAQTAYSAIATLERAGILEEYTGRSWGRLYMARELRELIESARPPRAPATPAGAE